MAKRNNTQGRTPTTLQARLKTFTDALEKEVEGDGDQYEMDDILSPSFLAQHTPCKSFGDFQAQFSFDLNKNEYSKAERRVLDKYIRKKTKFRDFSSFALVAMAEHATDQAKRKVRQRSPNKRLQPIARKTRSC